MPRFLVTRTLPPISPEQLEGVGKQVRAVCNEIPGMSRVRGHSTADGKHSFCEFEAPSAEACREHARRAGLPVEEVIPLGLEIGRSMFQ